MSWGHIVLIGFAVLTLIDSLAVTATFVRELRKDGNLTIGSFLIALFWLPLGIWYAVVDKDRS